MNIQRLASLLQIRPNEGRLVILSALLFAFIQAGQGMGDNAASALFLLRFGVDFLPYMYMFLGALTFITTLAYSAGLGRFERGRFFLSLVIGLIALLLIERLALQIAFPLLYPIVWLTVNCMAMILGTLTWNIAGEICDARQAKRLFPLFASAGILGSVLGNLITGGAAELFGTDNLLVLYAALLAVVYLLMRGIAHSYFRPGKPSAQRLSFLDDLRAGFDTVRGSSLLQLIAFTSVLFSILFFSIAFPFSKIVTVSFTNENEVAGFLGLFNSLTTAATFLVSLLLANRLYSRIGIVNSVLLMPLAYLFGFAVFASRFTLTGAVIARSTQLIVLSGLAGTAWNALFNVVPSQQRGQVLAFNNGVPSQVGVALSGLLLILGENVLTTTQIFLMGILFTLICGLLIWRMRSAYGDALLQALRAGRLEVFASSEAAFAGLQGDAAALQVVTRALQDAKPTTRRLAAEILGKMQNASAIPALTHHLSDPEAGVRAAVIRALGELRAASALNPTLLASLEDPDAEVRHAALVSLAGLELQPSAALSEKLERLLTDPSINVRTQTAITLAKIGQGERAFSSLIEWLGASDLSLRLTALEAIGQIAGGSNGQFEAAPVLSALRDPSIPIRQAACRALAGFKESASTQALVACLYDPDASVRHAASESLRLQGPGVCSLILEVLDSKNATACDAALEALSPDNPEISASLRLYAGEEITRLRSLQAQIASLPADGSAVTLLRTALQDQVDHGEGRLVKIVGLLGNPRAMELVQKSLGKSNAETRAAALEALETLGDKQLARRIIALAEEEPPRLGPSAVIGTILKDGARWSRALAIRVLQELNLREFIPRLNELKSDPDALVSQTAIRSLHGFGEVPMDTLQTVSILERVLLLREVPIFAGLPLEDLERVAEIAREQWYPQDATIFRQGEQGDAMYIIVSGQVQVLKETDGKSRLLARRGPGDFIGEMAILESGPRSAGLVTEGEVRVLAFQGAAFKSILRERPDVSLLVLQGLSRRLREMSE